MMEPIEQIPTDNENGALQAEAIEHGLENVRILGAGRKAYKAAQDPRKLKMHVPMKEIRGFLSKANEESFFVVLDHSCPVDELHLRDGYGRLLKKWKGVR